MNTGLNVNEDDSLAETIAKISEFNEISLYMKDEDIDKALEKLIEIIANPHIPAHVAAPLVVWLQALSVKFNMQAKYHMLYSTEGDRTKKKNTYLSASDGLEKLSNALKYLVK